MKLEKYKVQVNGNQEIINWIDTALAKRLKKNPESENQGEIEHILDFMQSDKAPKRLQKMSYDQAKVSAEKWVKTLAKKGKNIDDSTGIKGVLRWKKSGMRLVKLVSKEAFEREGNLMSHCVASYYGKKDVTIYSLRDSKNMPHCTIEVQGTKGQINQIKGKGNGSIHPNYIKYIVRVLKKFGMDVRESEMSNLGYIPLSSLELKLLTEKNLYKNKIFKMKDTYFIYKY